MKRYWLAALASLFIAACLGTFLLLHLSLAALNDPGRIESYFASTLKRMVIRRNSRHELQLRPPADRSASVREGDKLFGADCAMCHGVDGRTPTEAGKWMYPRAADLASPQVRRYTDAELFWIVKNGIRFTGMPAFGKVESDEHIWNLVHYVRSLNEVQLSLH